MRKTVILLVIAGLLAGCNLLLRPTPTREVDTQTPEGAVMRYAAALAPQADAAANSFSTIHTWSLGRDSLVAYSFAGGYEAQWSVCNGQARVTLDSGGWRVVEAGTRCWDDQTAAITGSYAFIAGDDGAPRTVIYGDLLVPDVSAVSIEFTVGGESAVAEIDSAGYWLMRAGAHRPARAVAIDKEGYLVQILEFDRPLVMEPVGTPQPPG
ncbi:MAG: hypothetical protein JXB47_17580 [Anaerolineae bacterium]|nr:hypothetical protein [Anaerolineae bacterium]